MPFILARNWWSLVVRGCVGIVLGIFAFAVPGATVQALVLLFGAYALVDGVVSLASAVGAANGHERWAAMLLEGVTGIIAAIATIAWPALTAFVLVYIIGAWAVVTGVAEIAAARHIRKHIAGEWLLGLAGVVSIVFGIVMFVEPLVGAFVVTVCFGVYALLFGVVLLALGLRLRRWQQERSGASARLAMS